MSAGRRGAPKTLTQELAALLNKVLLPDLTARARTPSVEAALKLRFDHEAKDHRTSEKFGAWIERTVEQVGAAWILSCVFVRTLEDRGLLAQKRIFGEEGRSSEQLFFELAPALTHRDYLLTVFREISMLPGARTLFDPAHNPAWKLAPSNESVSQLLEILRAADAAPLPTPSQELPSPAPRERGGGEGVPPQPKWRFDGPSTRFLGDLYQDLSASVRERYALLQTPDFVEEFILDQTLEPAIQEFGLDAVRLIDPTCGSGHFLLGAFHRLCEHHHRAKPALDRREVALLALNQVYGVDLNPYAVAITRFRLTLAFLEEAKITRLATAPKLSFNLVVADSLLHGGKEQQLRLSNAGDEKSKQLWMDELFDLEDPGETDRILGQHYHAVVGNPPYKATRDKSLREEYRQRYESASGRFTLSAPFTERFFQLGGPGGFIGLINANTFLRRQFGRQLIQSVLPRLELTKVIDTSGSYIPGHGWNIMLFGRNQAAKEPRPPVTVVMSKHGDPGVPPDPARAPSWQAICQGNSTPGFENNYISVSSVRRETLDKHPWSIGGGGAAQLKEDLDEGAATQLRTAVSSIGFGAILGEDDFFLRPLEAWSRSGVPAAVLRPLAIGDGIRNWSMAIEGSVVFPYNVEAETSEPTVVETAPAAFWPWRTTLWGRAAFGAETFRQAGRHWYEFHQIPLHRLKSAWSIPYAEVVSHNHFVIGHSGTLFNRTAPVITLADSESEGAALTIVGQLNSSVAEFWMKQVFQPKGGDKLGAGARVTGEPWEERFQRSGNSLLRFPLGMRSSAHVARIARALGQLGAERRNRSAKFVAIESAPQGRTELTARLVERRAKDLSQLMQMVWLQEELDWSCYEIFGLASEGTPREEIAPGELQPGLRSFEVSLARSDAERRSSLARGQEPEILPTEWFSRHGWEPHTTLDALPPSERAIVEARLASTAASRELQLIEQPTYKRRWYRPDYAAEERAALEGWLSDRLETFATERKKPFSAREAASALQADPGVQAVAELLAGNATYDLEELLRLRIRADQAPFLPSLLFTEEGLHKRAQWERTWELQREEDAGKKVEIPVPPKYDNKDFRSGDVYRLRGKLDVPKERFISYPGLQRDEASGELVAWAGLTHLERLQCLAEIYQQRRTHDGWEKERLVPMLAGILDLLPWVKQWHNDPDPNFDGERLGDFFERFLNEELRTLGLRREELRAWRPTVAAKGKGAPRKKKAAAATTAAGDAEGGS